MLIAINFVSLCALGHYTNRNNHVVAYHVDVDEGQIKYFDSNVMKTRHIEMNSLGYRKLRFSQKLMFWTLRIYDMKPKIEANFEFETVYATYGKLIYFSERFYWILNRLLIVWIIRDSVLVMERHPFTVSWTNCGREKRKLPQLSETRNKSGKVMKAFE